MIGKIRAGILVALLGGCSSAPELPCPKLTFLQIYAQSSQGNTDYRAIVRQTRSLGFDTIILQWSSYDDVSFYTDPRHGKSVDSALESVVRAACGFGLKLWIGLHYDSQFWMRSAASHAEVKKYLDSRLQDLRQRLPQLLILLARENPPEDCIQGWYITDEIDDMTWSGDVKQNLLSDYLKATASLLHEARPDWPIAISGFTNQVKSPEAYAEFWDALLTASKIDVLLFQDGVGAGKLTLETAMPYLQALVSMARRKKHTVITVLELFEMRTVDGKAQFSSANAARIKKQLALAGKAGGGGQVAVFAATPYLLEADMPGSQALATFWNESVAPVCVGNR